MRPKNPPTTELIAARCLFNRNTLISPETTIATTTAHNPRSGVTSCRSSHTPMNTPTRMAV
jgi:hypothetical protein